jgi:hypothetical protein
VTKSLGTAVEETTMMNVARKIVYSTLVMLGANAASVVAGGSLPSVDAGPAKVIAFPAKDITLFGHATVADVNHTTYSWSQVSGPSGAAFSAPWALATTVTFRQPGNYTFRLTVSDGTNTVTADTTTSVLSADTQTAFYVDPTYIGGSNDGSAGHPWTSLTGTASSPQWMAINSALATNNVIVYFSARTAADDVAEVVHTSVDLWRTDTSTHRLTLDGMSLYNTNDAAPVWMPQNGTSRFHIDITSGSLSIGVQSNNSSYPMHYTTIRGFELSGASGRALVAGNATVFEYNFVHDVSVTGATVQFQAAVRDYPDCRALFGNLHDITFRKNVIQRGQGESIYVAGTYTRQSDGGCLSWGNTHSDILIESNQISDAGSNGGEHDGIDLKAGLTNVTIRRNLIADRPSGTKAITALGVFYSAGTCCIGNYVIEDNVFLRNAGSAIVLQKQNGGVVRNNTSHGGGDFETSGDDNTSYWISQNVAFFNNTIQGNANGGIGLLYANTLTVQNNLIFDNSTANAIQGSSTVTNAFEDFNVYTVGTSQISNGGHSKLVSSTSGLVVDATNGNFQLASGSIAIGSGINLITTGFGTDIVGARRQATAPWDVGAYTVGSVAVRRPPPSVRIVP